MIDSRFNVGVPAEAAVKEVPAGSHPLVYCDSCLVGGGARVSPDTPPWMAGDVILTRRPVTHKYIAPYQRLFYRSEDIYLWSHAAVYDGVGHIWDAQWNDVVQPRLIKEFLEDEVALFHILRYTECDIDFDRLHQALEAQKGAPYNGMAASGRYVKRLIRRQQRKSRIPAVKIEDLEKVNCAEFVQKVLNHALPKTGKHQVLSKSPIAIPADFAADESFSSIATNWRVVVNCYNAERVLSDLPMSA